MKNSDINGKKEYLMKETGMQSQIFIKDLLIGHSNPIEACIVYVNGLANKDMIDRDILNPIMFQLKEELTDKKGLAQYLCLKYIPMCSTVVDNDLNNAAEALKSGKTVLLMEASEEVIIIDTAGGNYRKCRKAPCFSYGDIRHNRLENSMFSIGYFIYIY